MYISQTYNDTCGCVCCITDWSVREIYNVSIGDFLAFECMKWNRIRREWRKDTTIIHPIHIRFDSHSYFICLFYFPFLSFTYYVLYEYIRHTTYSMMYAIYSTFLSFCIHTYPDTYNLCVCSYKNVNSKFVRTKLTCLHASTSTLNNNNFKYCKRYTRNALIASSFRHIRFGWVNWGLCTLWWFGEGGPGGFCSCPCT